MQHGVVATVRTQLPHATAWQRFLPRGPLALLPVREGFSSIVWTTTPQRARELTEASPLEFAHAINEVRLASCAPAVGCVLKLRGCVHRAFGQGSCCIDVVHSLLIVHSGLSQSCCSSPKTIHTTQAADVHATAVRNCKTGTNPCTWPRLIWTEMAPIMYISCNSRARSKWISSSILGTCSEA